MYFGNFYKVICFNGLEEREMWSKSINIDICGNICMEIF